MNSIRESKIIIGDTRTGEVPRAIIGPELVFYSDHNFLMYPKSIIPAPAPTVKNADSSSESNSSNGEDDLDGIEEIPRRNFQ